jgi:DNA polymerase-3 subunit delta
MAADTQQKYQEILRDIDNKKFNSVYLLQGDEPYFIDAISKKLEENVLSEEERSFNQTVIYGKETTYHNVVMAARRFPMMAPYQLIVVKEAQNIKDTDSLIPYLEAPLDSTILVICLKGKKIDKRKKEGKLLSKFLMFNSERIRDYQISEWISRYVKSKNKEIDNTACQLIGEFLGTDLAKIASEIDKMLINIRDTDRVSMSHVEENIGISKDYNTFELQKALGGRNFNKSVQIINYFAADTRTHPLVMLAPNLFSYFTKLMIYHQNRGMDQQSLSSAMGVHSFFIKEYAAAALNYNLQNIEEIISIIRFYEMRAKGVENTNTSEGQLMIEMIVRILRTQ